MGPLRHKYMLIPLLVNPAHVTGPSWAGAAVGIHRSVILLRIAVSLGCTVEDRHRP